MVHRRKAPRRADRGCALRPDALRGRVLSRGCAAHAAGAGAGGGEGGDSKVQIAFEPKQAGTPLRVYLPALISISTSRRSHFAPFTTHISDLNRLIIIFVNALNFIERRFVNTVNIYYIKQQQYIAFFYVADLLAL